jgi:hypothetical protein
MQRTGQKEVSGGWRRSHDEEILFLPTITLVSCSAYSSTLKMEVACSTETLIDFEWITRRYIPEDITPQEIYNLYFLPSNIRVIKSRRLWGAMQHALGETRNEYKILIGKFEERKPVPLETLMK